MDKLCGVEVLGRGRGFENPRAVTRSLICQGLGLSPLPAKLSSRASPWQNGPGRVADGGRRSPRLSPMIPHSTNVFIAFACMLGMSMTAGSSMVPGTKLLLASWPSLRPGRAECNAAHCHRADGRTSRCLDPSPNRSEVQCGSLSLYCFLVKFTSRRFNLIDVGRLSCASLFGAPFQPEAITFITPHLRP